MRRRLPALILVSALALSGVACGSGEGDSRPPQQVVRESSERVIDAGSSRMSIAVESTGMAGISIDGEGTFDYQSRRGTLTMDTSSMAATGLPKELEIVLSSDVVYMNLGSLLPGGKEWAKLELADASELGPQFASLAQLGSNNDPRAFLAYTAGVKDVKAVGEEKVRGDDATHYTATVDLQAAADAVDDPDLKKPLETTMRTLGATTLPAEFWVDGEGRLRRYRSEIDLAKMQEAAASGATGTVSTVVEFYDFGAEVKADAPPDDEVTDLGELLKGGQGGGAG